MSRPWVFAKCAALLTITALGLSACAAGTPGGSTSGIPKPSVSCDVPAGNISPDRIDTSKVAGEITFMTQGLQKDFGDFFRGQLAQFEKENPGTKINWVDQGGSEDFDNLIATQAQGCKMADVINVPSSTILALSKSNLLMDLDTKAPGVGDKFIPSIWKSIALGAGNRHTALPWYFGPAITTYNKEVFQKAGLPDDSPGATMAERFERAEKIASAKTGDFAIYGNAGWYLGSEWAGMGVKLMNDDQTKFTFAGDPNARSWVENMAKLYKIGAIPPDSLTGDLDPGKAYSNGNLAYGTPNASFLRSVKQNNPKVYANTGVGQFPRNPGVKPLFNGQFIAVSVTTANAPLALKFAEYMTSDEQSLAWTRDGGAIIFPVTTASLDKLLADPPKTQSDPVFAAAYKQAGAEAKEAVAYPALFYTTGKVQTTLKDTLNKAIRGEMDVQAALDQAQTEMNKLLAALHD